MHEGRADPVSGVGVELRMMAEVCAGNERQVDAAAPNRLEGFVLTGGGHVRGRPGSSDSVDVNASSTVTSIVHQSCTS